MVRTINCHLNIKKLEYTLFYEQYIKYDQQMELSELKFSGTFKSGIDVPAQ